MAIDSRKKKYPRRLLALPGLAPVKTAVLNSLTSAAGTGHGLPFPRTGCALVPDTSAGLPKQSFGTTDAAFGVIGTDRRSSFDWLNRSEYARSTAPESESDAMVAPAKGPEGSDHWSEPTGIVDLRADHQEQVLACDLAGLMAVSNWWVWHGHTANRADTGALHIPILSAEHSQIKGDLRADGIFADPSRTRRARPLARLDAVR
jgi:hypothetical protein